MSALRIPAPAKLNLFLHITGQRSDGYHELETLFQFLDIADELYIETSNNGRITLTTMLDGVTNENNLIYRAAHLLMPYRKKTSDGARITLDKRIPMGGGLGGGSSDAASTLIALNHLWDCQLSRSELARIGLQLGADVPVFIHGQATLARGVGEQFSPAEPESLYYLVINPRVHINTADIFRHPDLPRATPALSDPLPAWQDCHNDCQSLVCSLYPSVAKAIKWLVNYAPTRMTGTGACVFGWFNDRAHAQRALAELSAELHGEFSGFVTQGVNESPAWQALHRSQT